MGYPLLRHGEISYEQERETACVLNSETGRWNIYYPYMPMSMIGCIFPSLFAIISQLRLCFGGNEINLEKTKKKMIDGILLLQVCIFPNIPR